MITNLVDIRLVDKIQDGFPTTVVEGLLHQKKLTPQELYTFIPARTWARRIKEHRLSPEESDRIAMLQRIIFLSENVFGDNEKAHAWLRRENRALENRIPLDFLHTETGTRLIEGLLERIQHGIYS